jgi:hypothetical protein
VKVRVAAAVQQETAAAATAVHRGIIINYCINESPVLRVSHVWKAKNSNQSASRSNHISPTLHIIT